MSTLNLYHGTFASLVPSIMERGLEPRGERPSHDAYMDSASMPPFVYLTANYGTAVAHACRISERTADGAAIAVLELDIAALKRRLIYPDEDYLQHEWNSDFQSWSLKKQLEFMEYHRDTWRESLEMFKTIAYKGIVPVKAITVLTVKRWLEQKHRPRFMRRTA